MKDRIVVFDLETTGPVPATARVCQVALVSVSDGRHSKWSTLINPQEPIPPGASRIHGIKDEDVSDQPTWELAAEMLHKAFTWVREGGGDIVAYNGRRFDVPIVNAECERIGFEPLLTERECVDPFVEVKSKLPYGERSLGKAYRTYTGKEPAGAHDAFFDCHMTLEIYKILCAGG